MNTSTRQAATSRPEHHMGDALPRQSRVWPAVAVLIAVIGSVASVFGAILTAEADSADARDAFETASAEIAATLGAAIQAEADLTVNAAGYIVGNPETTNDEFVAWAESVRVAERYPELRAMVFATIVADTDLDTFLADVTSGLPAGGPFAPTAVIPGGDRDLYCLTVAKFARGSVLPPGMDFCATDLGAQLLDSRDSGLSSYMAITDETFTAAAPGGVVPDAGPADPAVVEDVALLLIQAPMYRSGATPTSVTARQAEFLGWVAIAVSPDALLDSAVNGHDDIALSFRYDTGDSAVVFSHGSQDGDGETRSFDFGNGWTAETSGAIDGASVWSAPAALTILSGGVVLSLAVAALVTVLSTGRARALRFVEEMTEELRHQAMHDPLTGLPNRNLIADRTEQLLARSRRNRTVPAALFLDLDEFKNINDTLGHDAGDEVLKAVATRLTSVLRGADTIGRLGGDEFVVLVDDASGGAADQVARRLLDIMREPLSLEALSHPISVSVSIGVALGDRESPSDLLRDADVALYQAKANGRNCHATFSSEMEDHIKQRLELEFDLRSALDGGQFRIVYQPMYDLSDLSLIGVEALLRWDHPVHGVIGPDGFVHLLESSGKIAEVGRWVLAEACTRAAKWRDDGSDLTVSINVSARQLAHPALLDDVRDALGNSGLDPAALAVEISESALMRDVETTTRRLEELKTLGVGIAIDDFGTGYSSVAHLQRFPVDRLKIDRAFTDGLTHSVESIALMHTLVQLGRSLGLRTLAEGVETTDQIDRLRAEGVDEVQGYLLSRPLDGATLEAQLLAPLRSGIPSEDQV